ncbi:MAG: hypothetical protein AAF514_04795 [Verrucomicrobiota bacterium]
MDFALKVGLVRTGLTTHIVRMGLLTSFRTVTVCWLVITVCQLAAEGQEPTLRDRFLEARNAFWKDYGEATQPARNALTRLLVGEGRSLAAAGFYETAAAYRSAAREIEEEGQQIKRLAQTDDEGVRVLASDGARTQGSLIYDPARKGLVGWKAGDTAVWEVPDLLPGGYEVFVAGSVPTAGCEFTLSEERFEVKGSLRKSEGNGSGLTSLGNLKIGTGTSRLELRLIKTPGQQAEGLIVHSIQLKSNAP